MDTDTDTKPAVKARFTFQKETPKTHKFEEQPEPGQAPMMGALYVQKYTLHQLGNPDELIVTIEGK